MPRLKTGAINKHVSIRPVAVIGYDPVHLPHSDGGCVTASKRKQVTGALATFFFSGHRCPVVAAGLCEQRQRGEAGWIDGTAAGPTQL